MAYALIGFGRYAHKLVVAALTPNFLSLRDQCAHWSWQSPGQMENVSTTAPQSGETLRFWQKSLPGSFQLGDCHTSLRTGSQ